MSVRKEEDSRPQERRSDEELQAALAEISAKVAPFIADREKLLNLKNDLYNKYVAPLDAQLYEVRQTLLNYEAAQKQITTELKANQKFREAEEQVKIQAEKRRLAEEARAVLVGGLRQRLTDSADVLDKEPVELSQSLACALRKVVVHPDFGIIAGTKIGISGKEGSARLILGEANSEYFLSFNPSKGPLGSTVSQITTEVAFQSDTEGEIVENFLGFRVDTNDNHPVIPFVLVRHDKIRTSRMLLPVSAVDERFEWPLKIMSKLVRFGEISLQTTPGTEKVSS